MIVNQQLPWNWSWNRLHRIRLYELSARSLIWLSGSRSVFISTYGTIRYTNHIHCVPLFDKKKSFEDHGRCLGNRKVLDVPKMKTLFSVSCLSGYVLLWHSTPRSMQSHPEIRSGFNWNRFVTCLTLQVIQWILCTDVLCYLQGHYSTQLEHISERIKIFLFG